MAARYCGDPRTIILLCVLPANADMTTWRKSFRTRKIKIRSGLRSEGRK